MRDDRVKRCRQERSRCGFTVVEILMASFVVSLAMTGIYTVFFQALQTEKDITAASADRQSAEAVAAYLSQAVENAVRIGNIPAVSGGPGAESRAYVMSCVTQKSVYTAGGWKQSLRRVRFTWRNPEEDEPGQTLGVQEIVYAGTQDLSLPAGLRTDDVEVDWSRAPTQIVAASFRELSVAYRSISPNLSPWQANWSNPDPRVQVRIRVKVGEQTVERTTACHVDIAAAEKEQA